MEPIVTSVGRMSPTLRQAAPEQSLGGVLQWLGGLCPCSPRRGLSDDISRQPSQDPLHQPLPRRKY